MAGAARQRALVLRAQSGDRQAFDVLLRDIVPPLLRYVTRVTNDTALAEDVVQETLMAIVRKIGWLSDPSLFRPWAYRIASREAFRALRRRGRVEEPVDDATALDEPPDPWHPRHPVLRRLARSAAHAHRLLHGRHLHAGHPRAGRSRRIRRPCRPARAGAARCGGLTRARILLLSGDQPPASTCTRNHGEAIRVDT